MSQPQGLPQADPIYADLRRRDPVRPALILDVRDPDEFATVRVEGSLHIPFPVVGLRLADIPRDRPILVLCASGSRSAAITNQLLANGFEDVGNVAGGISTWERMGLPVRRGPLNPGEGRGSGA